MKNQMTTISTFTSIVIGGILILLFSCNRNLPQVQEQVQVEESRVPNPISKQPPSSIPISNNRFYDFRCTADRVFYKTLNSDLVDSIDILKNKEEALEVGGSKSFIPPSYKKTVPVVFHVVHQCGVEKIEMRQIQQAVADLNKDFRGEHLERLRDISDPFIHMIGKTNQLKFKLATLDPHGNATTGVHWVEHYSSINGGGLELPLKNYIQWPREKYLNIWVVSSSGGSGYAHYPWTTDKNEVLDGIVISHNYLGTTGTSEAWAHKRRKILTHEVGHWLGLRHTWGDDAAYLAPGDSRSCPAGDGIEDTPTTIGSSAIIYPRYPDKIDGLYNPDSIEMGLSFRYDGIWNATDSSYYPTFYDPNPNPGVDPKSNPITWNSSHSIVPIDSVGNYGFSNTCDDGAPYDNIYNFMDYGSEIMFTREQVQFMLNIIRDTFANRNLIGVSEKETFIPDTQAVTFLTLDNYFFQESDQNDGTIKNKIKVRLSEGKWGSGWDTNTATNITSDDLPSGLIIKAKKLDDTTLEIELEGQVLEHSNSDDKVISLKICGDGTNCIVGQNESFWNEENLTSSSGDPSKIILLKGIKIDFREEGTMRHTIYRNRDTPDTPICLTDAVDHYIGFGLGIFRYLDVYAHKHLADGDTIKPEGFYLTKEGNSKVEIVSLRDSSTIALLDKKEKIDLSNLSNEHIYLELTKGVEEGMLALDKDLENNQSFPVGTKHIGLRFTFDCNENYYYGWVSLEFSQEGDVKKICLGESFYDANPVIRNVSLPKKFPVGDMPCPGNVVNADSNYSIEEVRINGKDFFKAGTDSRPPRSYVNGPKLEEGEKVRIQLKSGRPTSKMNWHVYVDKDKNEVFDRNDELVLQVSGTSTTAIDTFFMMPQGIGNVFNVRIISVLYEYDGYFPKYVLSPCGSLDKYGSFLDFTVDNRGQADRD